MLGGHVKGATDSVKDAAGVEAGDASAAAFTPDGDAGHAAAVASPDAYASIVEAIEGRMSRYQWRSVYDKLWETHRSSFGAEQVPQKKSKERDLVCNQIKEAIKASPEACVHALFLVKQALSAKKASSPKAAASRCRKRKANGGGGSNKKKKTKKKKKKRATKRAKGNHRGPEEGGCGQNRGKQAEARRENLAEARRTWMQCFPRRLPESAKELKQTITGDEITRMLQLSRMLQSNSSEEEALPPSPEEQALKLYNIIQTCYTNYGGYGTVDIELDGLVEKQDVFLLKDPTQECYTMHFLRDGDEFKGVTLTKTANPNIVKYTTTTDKEPDRLTFESAPKRDYGIADDSDSDNEADDSDDDDSDDKHIEPLRCLSHDTMNQIVAQLNHSTTDRVAVSVGKELDTYYKQPRSQVEWLFDNHSMNALENDLKEFCEAQKGPALLISTCDGEPVKRMSEYMCCNKNGFTSRGKTVYDGVLAAKKQQADSNLNSLPWFPIFVTTRDEEKLYCALAPEKEVVSENNNPFNRAVEKMMRC